MSDYHDKKHIDGGTTFNESGVNCLDADIAAGGSFIPAPTYTAHDIRCDTQASIVATPSS